MDFTYLYSAPYQRCNSVAKHRNISPQTVYSRPKYRRIIYLYVNSVCVILQSRLSDACGRIGRQFNKAESRDSCEWELWIPIARRRLMSTPHRAIFRRFHRDCYSHNRSLCVCLARSLWLFEWAPVNTRQKFDINYCLQTSHNGVARAYR